MALGDQGVAPHGGHPVGGDERGGGIAAAPPEPGADRHGVGRRGAAIKDQGDFAEPGVDRRRGVGDMGDKR